MRRVARLSATVALRRGLGSLHRAGSAAPPGAARSQSAEARLDEVAEVRDLLRAHAAVEPPAGAMDAIVAAVAAALEPGGVVLIREADATGGWRFSCVRWGNALKAAAFGHWGQRFHYRSPDEWLACFAPHGAWQGPKGNPTVTAELRGVQCQTQVKN